MNFIIFDHFLIISNKNMDKQNVPFIYIILKSYFLQGVS